MAGALPEPLTLDWVDVGEAAARIAAPDLPKDGKTPLAESASALVAAVAALIAEAQEEVPR
ncbi:hypothetical protein NHU_02147 [Rhodovulum sulfidophilum]|uniref:Uncharacterized protein n=1 Tax=Rhodovulum sulfidophilum TaxID=35806 RepID=A0A0D6B2Q9_RHOSU|nr:hypothetical protein NHU_02147 [Rhodovulum sulfidophilum]